MSYVGELSFQFETKCSIYMRTCIVKKGKTYNHYMFCHIWYIIEDRKAIVLNVDSARGC